MRIFYTINALLSSLLALLLLSGTARAAGEPASDTSAIARKRIDSQECRIVNFLIKKEMGSFGYAACYAEDALERSKKIGYAHGIAIALGCQAAIAAHGYSDF